MADEVELIVDRTQEKTTMTKTSEELVSAEWILRVPTFGDKSVVRDSHYSDLEILEVPNGLTRRQSHDMVYPWLEAIVAKIDETSLTADAGMQLLINKTKGSFREVVRGYKEIARENGILIYPYVHARLITDYCAGLSPTQLARR